MYNKTKQKQLLLYVDDENKIEKSQIIREVCVDLKNFNKNNEIMLINFIDVVEANINNNTYYIDLGIFINNQQNVTISKKMQTL